VLPALARQFAEIRRALLASTAAAYAEMTVEEKQNRWCEAL
jgi:hypothetical protein